MADDIIPGIQAGGQAGAQRGAAGGVDYRQLQNPEGVRTDLPDSGAAARAAALGSVFREFEGVGLDVHNQISLQEGALAGAASGATGHPQYKQGLARLTAYNQAFNRAATGAYAVQAEAQADAAATRLRVEANYNPDTFAATYSAVADGVVSAAPPLAQPMLRELYNKRLAQGLAAITGDKMEQDRLLHRQSYDLGIERDISQIAELQGSTNVQDHLAAADQLTKLSIKVQGGVNTGLYSIAEGQAKLLNAHKEITSQVFETQLDRELGLMRQSGESGDVTAFLDNFQRMHEKNLSNPNEQPILSEPEYNQLMGIGKQKLMQEKMLIAYDKMNANKAKEEKLEAGDRRITVMMANGTPGPVLAKAVASMVGSQDLKSEVGRAVLNSLQHGSDAPPNKQGLFLAENDPARFDWKPDDIAAKVTRGEFNWQQSIELTQKIESQRQGWENHAPIKDARAGLNALLKLPSGIALETASDAEKKAAANAQVELTRRLSALNPTERDAKADQTKTDVANEMLAQSAESKAAAFEKGKNYVEKTYGLKGDSPNPAKYAKGMAEADAQVKKLRDQAAQLRKGTSQ